MKKGKHWIIILLIHMIHVIPNIKEVDESQIREQMSGPDLHVFTLKFLALKKLVFPP